MRAILSIGLAGVLVSSVLLAGCEQTPGYYPNSDPALRKPLKTLRTDAAQREYPSTAPRVKGIAGRAQLEYGVKTVELANLGTEDWVDLEVWVNESYVCYLPKVEHGVCKSIPFNAFFDRDGTHVPRDSRTFIVQSVEVYIGGKLYEIKTQLPH